MDLLGDDDDNLDDRNTRMVMSLSNKLQQPGRGPPQPGRPVPPQSRPVPQQSRPVPQQSRPVPPQARPVPPQSRPVPPQARQAMPPAPAMDRQVSSASALLDDDDDAVIGDKKLAQIKKLTTALVAQKKPERSMANFVMYLMRLVPHRAQEVKNAFKQYQIGKSRHPEKSQEYTQQLKHKLTALCGDKMVDVAYKAASRGQSNFPRSSSLYEKTRDLVNACNHARQCRDSNCAKGSTCRKLKQVFAHIHAINSKQIPKCNPPCEKCKLGHEVSLKDKALAFCMLDPNSEFVKHLKACDKNDCQVSRCLSMRKIRRHIAIPHQKSSCRLCLFIHRLKHSVQEYRTRRERSNTATSSASSTTGHKRSFDGSASETNPKRGKAGDSATQKKKDNVKATCTEPGCSEPVYGKKYDKCRSHAGGKCEAPGCTRSARLKSKFCTVHAKVKSRSNKDDASKADTGDQLSTKSGADPKAASAASSADAGEVTILSVPNKELNPVREEQFEQEDEILAVAEIDGESELDAMMRVGDLCEMTDDDRMLERWQDFHVISPEHLFATIQAVVNKFRPGMKIGTATPGEKNTDTVEIEYLSYCAQEFLTNTISDLIQLARHKALVVGTRAGSVIGTTVGVDPAQQQVTAKSREMEIDQAVMTTLEATNPTGLGAEASSSLGESTNDAVKHGTEEGANRTSEGANGATNGMLDDAKNTDADDANNTEESASKNNPADDDLDTSMLALDMDLPQGKVEIGKDELITYLTTRKKHPFLRHSIVQGCVVDQ